MNEQTSEKSTNWLAFGLIIGFIFVIVALGGYLLLNSRKSEKTTPPVSTKVVTGEAVVNIIKEGFNPEIVTVKKGTTVTWTNTDSNPHQVASDPHPTHDLLKDLGDGEVLSTGDKFSYTFEKTGSFTYHDHLNPLKFHGTVVVQ